LWVRFLVTYDAKSDQIFGSVIAQSAPRLNVMDLKFINAPARLASPAVALQDFLGELPISFGVNPQARPFCADPFQNMTRTSSRSFFR
jgi:hypothetical protein